VIQVDQGAEPTSVALDRWARARGVVLAFSRPGTPGAEAHREAFDGTFRRGVPSQRRWASLAEAQHVPVAWRHGYTNMRPHKSLRHRRPARRASGGHRIPSRARPAE
jgi:putative transposase